MKTDASSSGNGNARLASPLFIFWVMALLGLVTFAPTTCHAFATKTWIRCGGSSPLQPTVSVGIKAKTTTTTTFRLEARRRGQHRTVDDDDVHFLLKDFSLYNGEVVDPYRTLKVSRRANAREIKQAYRRLSRLYHPDSVRHRDILPGSCNNLHDVREHWERINWSYDVLNHPEKRRKYDRHEAWADPGKALQRAAAQAAWDGVTSLGKGLWNMGRGAVATMLEKQQQQQHAHHAHPHHHSVATTSTTAATSATVVTNDVPPPRSVASNNNNSPGATTATILEFKTHPYSSFGSLYNKLAVLPPARELQEDHNN